MRQMHKIGASIPFTIRAVAPGIHCMYTGFLISTYKVYRYTKKRIIMIKAVLFTPLSVAV